MKPARYLITWAQDATPVHPGFWAAMGQYCAHRRAELVVVAGQYRNPTSRFDEQFPDAEWAPETHPYLSDERRQLAPNLCLYGDIRIQPTRPSPLTGKAVFCAGNSAIFGHPSRALDVVPTATRMPRLLMSTSACTIANYSSTNAGKTGEAHHVIGALVVDIDAKGFYFPRHVTWDAKTKSFTDLDTRYYADRVEKAPRAECWMPGDVHVRRWSSDGKAERAARMLYDLLRPKHVVYNDLLDFGIRNHHRRSSRDQYAGRLLRVEDEMEETCGWLFEQTTWGDHETHVNRSNHDEAAERWLEEYDERTDPENAGYYHYLKWCERETFDATGEYPDILAMEYARLYPDEPIHFLKRDEELLIRGIQNGFHGDKGVNGSRGSPAQLAKLGCKINGGHTHTGRIIHGYYGAGVYGSLDHGYNGLPSTWTNSDIVTHADGKRQLIIRIDGRFRA